jgi:RNA polymerase sigma-70 factor (ECF subfamily)
MKPSAVSSDNPLDPTDASLMAGIRSRDSQALAQLYDRHSSMVFALCVRMLRDRNDAEDVMLDVFWELWDRAERYDASRASPLTYLLRVTRSRLIDRLRARRSRKRAELASVESVGASDFEADASGAEPLAGTLRTEERALVVRAMSDLTPDQRQAVEMAFFDAMTHTEIAAQLNEPLGTIKSRIRQALIRLRQSLGALDGT